MYKFAVAFLALFYLNAIPALASEPKNYVGQGYVSLSHECTQVEGGMIEKSEYTLVHALCSDRDVLWLVKREEFGPDQIIDQVTVRSLNHGEKLTFAASCYLNGKFIDELSPMILNWGSRKKITAKNGGLLSLWRVNLTTKKIKPLSPALLSKVSCVSEDS